MLQPTSLLAVVALWCRAAARAADFEPIDRYLSQFGISALPPLHVVYSNHSTSIELHGASSSFVNEDSPFLRQAAHVSWPAREGRSFTLAFIDLGPDTGSARMARRSYPFVHALWTRCKSTLDDCALPIKPYMAPGNFAAIANRYTFVLFQHAPQREQLMLFGRAAVRFLSAAERAKLKGRSRQDKSGGFSLARLLRENEGLQAVAYNFMNVRGRRTSSRVDSGRRRTRSGRIGS